MARDELSKRQTPNSERDAQPAQPRVAAGKSALTSKLPSRSSEVAQRKPAASSNSSGARAATSEDWSQVAFRPDVHSAPIQAKGMSEETGSSAPASSSGGGARMPEDVQAKMEKSFDADFSNVRIHEGSQASDVGAIAYTQGTDIHFAPGQYQPGSQSSQQVLGHELAHVVQQSQGRVQATAQAKGVAMNDDPGLEREADAMGARAARGEPAGNAAPGPSVGSSGPIQRVAESDAAAILELLPPEILRHFQRVEKDPANSHAALDATAKIVWPELKKAAMWDRSGAKAKRRNLKEVTAFLEGLSVADAAKLMTQAATTFTENARQGRRNERQHADPTTPFMPRAEIVKFEIPGIGWGELEILKGNGNDTLLFAAHGYTRSTGTQDDLAGQEKSYGFMAPSYATLDRSGDHTNTIRGYKNQIDADKFKRAGVPDLACVPHGGADAIRDEGGAMAALVDTYDIAILRDWEWADTPEAQPLEIANINSVPLALVLGSDPLKGYGKHVLQVCRTGWERSVPVGSTRIEQSKPQQDLQEW